MLGFRVLRAHDVILVIGRDQVMTALQGVYESSLGYLRRGVLLGCFSIPFYIMSLSDQHPYAQFVAGGLRSPLLAKARVEVGDNADAYLASTDVVTFFRPSLTAPTLRWTLGRLRRWSS